MQARLRPFSLIAVRSVPGQSGLMLTAHSGAGQSDAEGMMFRGMLKPAHESEGVDARVGGSRKRSDGRTPGANGPWTGPDDKVTR
jgi:hypothetical protein